MYAKLFSRITESSLMEEPIPTRYVFVMLLAMADPHGYVIGTDVAISRRLNMSVTQFNRAKRPLMDPDINSNSKIEDGRRIVPSDTDRGYRIVNYLTYRNFRDEEARRAYQREYRSRYRAEGKDRSRPVNLVNTGQLGQPGSTQAEAEADTENICGVGKVIYPPNPIPTTPTLTHTNSAAQEKKEENKFKNAPTLPQAVDYFESAGTNYSRAEIKRAWQGFSASAVDGIWMWGRRPVTDWRYALEVRLGENRDRNPNANTAKTAEEAIIRRIKAIQPKG